MNAMSPLGRVIVSTCDAPDGSASLRTWATITPAELNARRKVTSELSSEPATIETSVTGAAKVARSAVLAFQVAVPLRLSSRVPSAGNALAAAVTLTGEPTTLSVTPGTAEFSTAPDAKLSGSTVPAGAVGSSPSRPNAEPVASR